jgi:protein-tyrosine phosphatase
LKVKQQIANTSYTIRDLRHLAGRALNLVADLSAVATSYIGVTDKLLLTPLTRLIETKEPKLLIICQGNICRSPYAETALRHLMNNHGLKDRIAIASAGLNTTPGRTADETATRIAALRGIPLSGHLTESLTTEMVEAATCIFAMEPTQLIRLQQLFPNAKGKGALLGAFGIREYKRATIPDPYGKEDGVFQSSFDQIDLCLQKLVLKLAN